jgi:hypothetical protein
LAFDLDRALRVLKPQKRTRPLKRRSDAELRWVDDELPIGRPLLLDTSVYLDVLQGRSPGAVDTLITHRICHHSAVCLAELTHVFGRLDPAHAGTGPILQAVRATVEDMPAHRLHAPDVALWGQTGMVAGELARLSGLPRNAGQERKFLNDVLVFLQAGTLGVAVLTGNLRDFDWLEQLVPGVEVLFYRG